MLQDSGRILICGFDGEFTTDYRNEIAKTINNRIKQDWYAADKNELQRVFQYPETKYKLLVQMLNYEVNNPQIVIFVWIDEETAAKDEVKDYSTKVPLYLSLLREIMGERTKVFVVDGSRKMPKAREMGEIILREINQPNPIRMDVRTITDNIFKELTIVEIV